MHRADGMVATLLRDRMGAASQREFAREVGVSEAVMSRLLRGKYRLGRSAAGRITAAFPEIRPWLALAVLETPADDGLEAAG